MKILRKDAIELIEKFLLTNFELIDDNCYKNLSERLVLVDNSVYAINSDFKEDINKILFSSNNVKFVGFYVGDIVFLEDKQISFSPSLMFLREIKNKNTLKLPRQKAWLFTNNRTVSILDKNNKKEYFSSKSQFIFTILDNSYRFLGVGNVILEDFSEEMFRLKIKNIKNIGDFLKREQNKIKR